MLRDYEILYIVRPELDETQLGEAVQGVNKLIEGLGGNPTRTDVWGRRRLAYEVKHLREGQYVLQLFEIEPGAVPEMEAALHISESVFRHLIVRRPDRVAPVETVAATDVEAATPEGAGEPEPTGADEESPTEEPETAAAASSSEEE